MQSVNSPASDHRLGNEAHTTDRLVETGKNVASQVRKQTEGMMDQTIETAKQYPYATLFMTAAVAFAFGALWKAGTQPRRFTMDDWLNQLPRLPDAADKLRSYWR
ncbi:MAG: hypothetical protein EKK41_03390 [Hyphomicrobiales bacterium]|nr:MAG: hypothetical protein EKK41_03390 [Hyphomicrobiales bacterium]